MSAAIGVIDFGVGGLGFVSLLKKDFPDYPLIYFSDAGAIPYGMQSRKALRSRIEKVLGFVFSKGAKQIVVACHSASSVIMPTDQHVLGIRQLTVEAVKNSSAKVVGVIGGGRTIRSGFYRQELTQAGFEVYQRVAQELSILVERGELYSDHTRKVVRHILRPIRHVDTLLLACTHYPVLNHLFQMELSRETQIIDPIAFVFQHFASTLEPNATGGEAYYTTGDARGMRSAAKVGFDWEIGHVIEVEASKSGLSAASTHDQ